MSSHSLHDGLSLAAAGSTSEPPRSGVRVLGRWAVVAWSAAVLLVVSLMMGSHWYGLPRPELSDPRFVSAIAGLRPEGHRGWHAVHVLYSECRCSENVVTHHVMRPRLEAVAETLLWVGRPTPSSVRAAERGQRVPVVDPDALERDYHVEAAPLLVAADDRDRIRYAGGYSERKQGPSIEDVSIVRELLAGGDPDSLPLFGCATARELARSLDPLSLRGAR